LLESYLDFYNIFQKRRHEVRPGLTGLAQVNGRNEISWEQIFVLDVKYVDNISFVNDIKIFFKTIIKVFAREGISQKGVNTMETFKGNFKDIIIIGAGGFGREIVWLIDTINKKEKEWNIIGFIDDFKEKDTEISRYRVIGDTDLLMNYDKEIYVIIAIGNSEDRKNLYNKLLVNINIKFPVLIAPTASIGNNVDIGEGSIICAYSTLTTDIKIGKNVIINVGSTIGHDATIEDFVTGFPSISISGYDTIGESSHIGVGSRIIQNLKIGPNTIIGAGAVVIKDIEGNCTVVGVPAEIIKQKI
jgi:sugar O-acyltransferase (sialic acid O-acetyltransferase NeuD family)